jgi:hypothetical protein
MWVLAVLREIPSAPRRVRSAPGPRSPGRSGPRAGDPAAGARPGGGEYGIERIYAKTGATSRSTATLFALRNGLLDPLEL